MDMQLIYPMYALVLLTAVVLGISFIARVRAVRARQLTIGYFKTFTGAEPPEDVIKTSRHFVNLFEAPVLFYAGCLAALALHLTSSLLISSAWLFVVARIIHAYIHMGKNSIRPRMLSYTLGWVAILVLWTTVVIMVYSAT